MTTTYTFGPSIPPLDFEQNDCPVQGWYEKLLRDQEDIARRAAGRCVLANSTASLTDAEKVAIALCARCEIDTEYPQTGLLQYPEQQQNTLTIRTRNPVGFAIIDGRMQVFEKRNPEEGG